MIPNETPDLLRINRRKLKSLIRNAPKSAEAINLVYVSDKQDGIQRVMKDGSFTYVYDGMEIVDAETLACIRSLALPPAWTNVWICALPDGHLQAVGTDSNGRKQYRYHLLWNVLRSETKFFQLYDFGKALMEMRRKVNADLMLPGLPRQKVLATIISLMQRTGIRVGNNLYEKLYGSVGVSTLKDNHLSIRGNELKFSFKGKKGVYHDITLKSKKLSKIIAQCRDIPGKELFQYYDENGKRQPVDSGMVNNYIKEISGKHFTSKDFRTWTGTLAAIKAFLELGYADSDAETKRRINEAIDIAATQLGNTRNVCRKYYVHPVVIDHYVNNTLDSYLIKASRTPADNDLTPEEQILMKILGEISETTIQLSGKG